MVDRILIFGDSITQGMWDSRGGWAQRLIDDQFERQMADLEADLPLVFNLGISADTTTHLLKRFEAETKARQRPGLAFVFAIGTNDSMLADGQPFLAPEQYAANIESLVAKAKQFTDPQRILFVGLQPCDETRTAPVSWGSFEYTNQRLQLFDRKLKEVCAGQAVAYAPVFEAFQKAQKDEHDLLIDGLHPDDKGHELMYQLVAPAVAKLGR
jgi:lysophospholipase L1-like esterase